MEIVKSHKKISRKAMKADLESIVNDSLEMIDFCLTPPRNFKIILALAHSQINDIDPLRFFVTFEKEIIINPVINRHTNHTIDSLEGCVTFPENENKIVQRYNKCEVTYHTYNKENKIIKKEESLSGQRSKMFQHEIDHLNGIYIYN